MSKPLIGASASISKSFSEADVKQFAALSGDFNPIHIDPDYARTTMFGQRIVHGMLVSSLFSGLLAEKIPGPGAVYLGQTFKYQKPVFLDQEVTATVEVLHVREDKPIVTMSTVCTNPQGEVLISGEAILKYVDN